jgi:arsenite/tail-anchored protein-transporting ATPase
VFADARPEALLYRELRQELVMQNGTATLRLKVPFTEKAEIELKKLGLELIVRVAGHRRNIMLPPTLAPFKPREAKLDNGTLSVTFVRPPTSEDRTPSDGRSRAPAPKAV